jgi:hypothetical protein
VHVAAHAEEGAVVHDGHVLAHPRAFTLVDGEAEGGRAGSCGPGRGAA